MSAIGVYRGNVGEQSDAHEVGDEKENSGDDHGVEEVAREVGEFQVRSQSKSTSLLYIQIGKYM